VRLGYSDSGPRHRGEAPSWRPSDQSAERKVGLPSDPAVVADRRRQFGGWEWPGTILPTDSIVVPTDFDRLARLHIGGEPLVMCHGSQRQRSAPQGQRSLWPSHGLLQALATNGQEGPAPAATNGSGRRGADEGSYVKRLVVRRVARGQRSPSRMPLARLAALGPVGPSLTARGRARLCSEEGLGGG
jgi:hypothetical protein